MSLELYGTATCPFTADLRDDLEWEGNPFVEYDVDRDPDAMQKVIELTNGRTVPVLVENGRVRQIGVGGRGCYV